MSDLNAQTDPLKSVEGAKAKELVKLLGQGVPKKQAEREAGITVAAMKRDPYLLARIQVLINNFTFDDVAGKSLVKAKLFEILLGGDTETKEVINAAKALTPLLGVEQKSRLDIHVQVDSKEAEESFKYVREYVDAEFEEIE